MAQATQTKRWFSVIAPDSLSNAQVGDILGTSEGDVLGKTVTMNLGDITSDARKQKAEVTLRVSAVDGKEAYTEAINVAMAPGTAKRSVRKGRSKVTDSFDVTTNDGKTIRVKPFVVTNSRIKNSAGTALRKRAKKALKEIFSSNSAEQAYTNLLNGTLQRQLKDELADITPIRFVDFTEAKLQ